MPRRTSRRRNVARETGYSSIATVPSTQEPPRSVRGVRLKVVSTFTILFALLCLAALLVGRTEMPVEAAADASDEPVVCPGCSAQSADLRNDNSSSFGFGSGGTISTQRKPRPKERNKRARPRTTVGLRLIHSQQEDQ